MNLIFFRMIEVLTKKKMETASLCVLAMIKSPSNLFNQSEQALCHQPNKYQMISE